MSDSKACLITSMGIALMGLIAYPNSSILAKPILIGVTIGGVATAIIIKELKERRTKSARGISWAISAR